jgi:hypothetical protein
VNGLEPGSELRLTGRDPSAISVEAQVVSLAPFERLDVIVNGGVVRTIRPAGDGTRLDVSATVELPGSGWVAVRVIGTKQRYVGDNYAFAQTTPVYVVRDGHTFTSAEDASFLLQVVQEIWRRVEQRDVWRTDADKESYRQAVEEAGDAYRRAIESARQSSFP